MKVVFGCDPNATQFKLDLMEYVKSLGHEVADLGSDDPIYANTAIRLATSVAAGECDRGILICGTGIGVSIAANKVPGAYAALVNNVYQAQRAQLSNNANIITELTNGAVEIGNIGDPEHLEYFKWSSPMKYYEEGYHAGETFLLLTAEECAEYAEAPALKQGEKVYEDGSYTVYVFDSTEELMNCAVARQ